MISKEELLNQRTKRDIDMEELEKTIDDNLKMIKPDLIINEEFKIKDILDDNYSDEVIQNVLNKYIDKGGYSEVKYRIKRK